MIPHAWDRLRCLYSRLPQLQHQHCTDEAQKAETVLSAVRYACMYVCIYVCMYVCIFDPGGKSHVRRAGMLVGKFKLKLC